MTTTPPAPADAYLEAALQALRMERGKICTVLSNDESAAVLARLEAAEKLATEVGKYRESLRLYGGGQLTDVRAALADYHNLAPAAEGE